MTPIMDIGLPRKIAPSTPKIHKTDISIAFTTICLNIRRLSKYGGEGIFSLRYIPGIATDNLGK